MCKRFDVYLVSLDPIVGSEIKKTRPCLVVSPDEMDRQVRTVIVPPMTTKGQPYPTRVLCEFQGRMGKSYWVKFARLISRDRCRSWVE